MNDRLAALLPYPASVRPQPGSHRLSEDSPVTASPGAGLAAAIVRRVLHALPWPGATVTGADPGTGARAR